MHKNRIALALSAALFSAFVCADGASIATVNGVAIPQSKVDMLVKQVAASGQATDTPELRSRIRESLIRNEIVVQEAAKKGLDKDPEVLAQLEMAKSQILSDAFVKDYVKNHPIAENMRQAEFAWCGAACSRRGHGYEGECKNCDEPLQEITQNKAPWVN